MAERKIIAKNLVPNTGENKNFTEEELKALLPYIYKVKREGNKFIKIILSKNINNSAIKYIEFNSKKDTEEYFNLFMMVLRLNQCK